ncbi:MULTISPECIES: HSP90 family protein [Amycolatopsis]|uniref:HSP90 family protein n=1 Tax=Amycolatopsis TaxID=1813 RepID=UPI0005604BC5|nr:MULTISPECIES: HSP90 family protein [Amycolatopsis]MCG3752866.1 HSP90 family protein [Amycolatopsis sp. Poz14]
MNRSFQVDLRGVVDLLSQHLYSSPRVYVRELLQNAVDAVTARRAADASAPAEIAIEAGDGTLRITDTGIGLSEAQVHELLATIGRSSKRDELGYGRRDFLGQFGIGLLSAFLVADETRVVTRSASGAPAVSWTGRADGTYAVGPGERDTIGTTVTLTARRGAEQWFVPETVADLATLYGSMLPFEITVNGKAISGAGIPWQADERSPGHRSADLVGYAQEVLGFTPFDIVDLDVPEAGLTGVAYVLPFPANPAERAGHRVYLKRMLLAENAPGLLPDWAFFARCVVDTGELRPTASREALYDDDQLAATREALGEQLRGWLVGLSATSPRRLNQFLKIHHLGVKALALHDDDMLRLVDEWWPLETNVGRMTLAEFRSRHGVLRYCATADEFDQLAGVAAAQNLPVINGGYTYDSELVERVGALEPGVRVDRLDPSDLTTAFADLAPDTALAVRPFVAAAQRCVDRLGCEVVLREFEPASLPVLYLVDRAASFAGELRATKEAVDELWAGVLSAFEKPERDRPQLVLNYRNPLVRRVSRLENAELTALAVESLYGQALLLGKHPIRPADSALLNRAFLSLLDHAVPNREN